MIKKMTWHLGDLDLNSINDSLFISVAEKHLNVLQIEDMLKRFAESQAIDPWQTTLSLSQNVKTFIQVGEQFHTQVMSLILIWLVTIVTTCQPELGTSALHL